MLKTGLYPPGSKVSGAKESEFQVDAPSAQGHLKTWEGGMRAEKMAAPLSVSYEETSLWLYSACILFLSSSLPLY